MSNYTFKKIEDIKAFDEFIINHPYGNIMQTSPWIQVKNDSWQGLCFGCFEENKLIAGALVLSRTIKGFGKMWYVPRGLVVDYSNETLVQFFIGKLKVEAKKHGAFLVKFDPEMTRYIKDAKGETIKNTFDNQVYVDMLSKHTIHGGYDLAMAKYIQPRFQMVVDLKQENLQSTFSKNAKRYIGSYQAKRGFDFYEETTLETIKEFARLSRITEQRQGVNLRNEAYFVNLYNAFNDRDQVKVFLGRVDLDKLIAFNEASNKEEEVERLKAIRQEEGQFVNTGALIVVLGTKMANMFYGASDDRFAIYRPGFEMHYFAMDWCQKHNHTLFNLGGVQGDLNDGLYQFKSKFNADIYEYVGEFDLVINNLKYQAFTTMLPRVKKTIKKMRKFK